MNFDTQNRLSPFIPLNLALSQPGEGTLELTNFVPLLSRKLEL